MNGDGSALRGFLKPTRTSRAKRGGDSEQRKRERELESLEKLADSAAERIARLNERFDESPRLIDQAAQATRELDDLIAQLGERKPANFEALIADAERAKGTIEEALLRPIEQMRAESERRMEIDRLILGGREREAAVLSTMHGLERTLGAQAWDRLDAVEAIVDAEQRHTEALRAARDEQAAYLEATQQIRGELESFFAGEGADFGKIAKRLQARLMVDKLFGPAFKAAESEIKAAYDTQIKHYTRETGRAANAAGELADALDTAAARIARAGKSPLATPTGPGTTGTALASLVAGGTASMSRILGKATGTAPAGAPIVVVGEPGNEPDRGTIGGLRPETYFDMMGRSLTAPLIDQLTALGINLPNSIKGALGGAAGGYLAAGPVGAVLGGLNGLGIKGKLGEGIGKASAGAQQGAQIDAIFDSLGIKSSKTGAAIGGALGSAFGPAGQLIGSIAGGLLGGALKSTKRGSAIIGGTGDGLGVAGFYGNSGSRKDQAGGFAGDAIEAVNRIAKQLGGTIDASLGKVSIGIREDRIVVDPQGRGFTKTSKFPDLKDFGDDAQAAIAFAVKNLIEDGVLKGLKDSEMRLIKAGNDIEAALQDVLDFRSVFQRLKAYKDPVGFALDELDSEFSRLSELFARAGASAAEYAQLEELYGIERAQAIEAAGERVAGSLRSLLNDLTTGDSGLSLRDRRANALAEYESLSARVQAGDVTAFDKFAESAQTLLDLERQLFGSQAGYFDRFFQVKGTATEALAEQDRLAREAAERDSPFATRQGEAAGIAPVVDSIHWLGDQLSADLERGLGQRLDRIADLLARTAANIPSAQSNPSPTMPKISGVLAY